MSLPARPHLFVGIGESRHARCKIAQSMRDQIARPADVLIDITDCALPTSCAPQPIVAPPTSGSPEPQRCGPLMSIKRCVARRRHSVPSWSNATPHLCDSAEAQAFGKHFNEAMDINADLLGVTETLAAGDEEEDKAADELAASIEKVVV